MLGLLSQKKENKSRQCYQSMTPGTMESSYGVEQRMKQSGEEKAIKQTYLRQVGKPKHYTGRGNRSASVDKGWTGSQVS